MRGRAGAASPSSIEGGAPPTPAGTNRTPPAARQGRHRSGRGGPGGRAADATPARRTPRGGGGGYTGEEVKGEKGKEVGDTGGLNSYAPPACSQAPTVNPPPPPLPLPLPEQGAVTIPVVPSIYLEGAAWVEWLQRRNEARDASLRATQPVPHREERQLWRRRLRVEDFCGEAGRADHAVR